MSQGLTISYIDVHRYTIIDEADEMVSPDWADDLRGIMGGGTVNSVLA